MLLLLMLLLLMLLMLLVRLLVLLQMLLLLVLEWQCRNLHLALPAEHLRRHPHHHAGWMTGSSRQLGALWLRKCLRLWQCGAPHHGRVRHSRGTRDRPGHVLGLLPRQGGEGQRVLGSQGPCADPGPHGLPEGHGRLSQGHGRLPHRSQDPLGTSKLLWNRRARRRRHVCGHGVFCWLDRTAIEALGHNVQFGRLDNGAFRLDVNRNHLVRLRLGVDYEPVVTGSAL
uniref:Putative secreted protein n=1 Tax=Ixodes ricinus TaxID=34613 RepID=A0A6B0V4V6_IXORI